MTTQFNVCIQGDKNIFKSKTAIKRFKRDLKNLDTLEEKLQVNKYFSNGYDYTVNKNENTFNVKIIKLEDVKKNNERNEKRKRLREKIKEMKMRRVGISSIKRNVPRELYKCYKDAYNILGSQIPQPDEVLNNPEQYKSQIQFFMNNSIKINKNPYINKVNSKYFNALAKELHIKPIDLNSLDTNSLTLPESNNKQDSGTDTEYESDSDN